MNRKHKDYIFPKCTWVSKFEGELEFANSTPPFTEPKAVTGRWVVWGGQERVAQPPNGFRCGAKFRNAAGLALCQ